MTRPAAVASATQLARLVGSSSASVFIWRTMPAHELKSFLSNSSNKHRGTGELWLTNASSSARQIVPQSLLQSSMRAAPVFTVPPHVLARMRLSTTSQRRTRLVPAVDVAELPRTPQLFSADHTIPQLPDIRRNVATRSSDPVENAPLDVGPSGGVNTSPTASGQRSPHHRYVKLNTHGDPVDEEIATLWQFKGNHGVDMVCVVINVGLFSKTVMNSIEARTPREAIAVATSMATSLLVSSTVIGETIEASATIEAIVQALAVSSEAVASAATLGIALVAGLVVHAALYALWPRTGGATFGTTVPGFGAPATAFNTTRVHGAPNLDIKSGPSIQHGAPPPSARLDRLQGNPVTYNMAPYHSHERVDVIDASEVEIQDDEVPLAVFVSDDELVSEPLVLTTSPRVYGNAFELKQFFQIDVFGEFVQFRTTNIVHEDDCPLKP